MIEIRDIREFQFILENTYTWAIRVYKLQINGFIDHWRAAHCSIDSTPRSMPQRCARLREGSSSQPGTPSANQIRHASTTNTRAETTTVLGRTRGTRNAPRAPDNPKARVNQALALARVIEISSGSESCEDSDTEDAEDAEDTEDISAYSPSSTPSTVLFTAGEGRSVQGSVGPPSARSSARSSSRPLSIRSSQGTPSGRSIRAPASASSRSQVSVSSSVDPLLDSANNDGSGYAPQQNVRKVFPDTCPRCQRTRRFFHNCHL